MKPCRNDGKGCGYLSDASDHTEIVETTGVYDRSCIYMGPEENLKHRA